MYEQTRWKWKHYKSDSAQHDPTQASLTRMYEFVDENNLLPKNEPTPTKYVSTANDEQEKISISEPQTPQESFYPNSYEYYSSETFIPDDCIIQAQRSHSDSSLISISAGSKWSTFQSEFCPPTVSPNFNATDNTHNNSQQRHFRRTNSSE